MANSFSRGEISFQGYLNLVHNKSLENDFINVSHMYFKIVEYKEISRIKKILTSDNYTYADEGGILIKVSTPKIFNCLGKNFLKYPKNARLDKLYDVKVLKRKYSFQSKNSDQISGTSLILQYLDIIDF